MNIEGRKSIPGDGSCMQHLGAADGQPTSVCSLEATLAAWPKPRSPADLRSAPKCFPFLGVVLSQDGRELWTATEGNSSGGISVTGYKRVAVGDRWQWQLTHSFAALSGLSRDAQTSRVVMHLLPASRCIALVCSNGLLYVLCIEDTAAPPRRIPLENYMRPKSCTLVRTMRRDMDTAPVDMITHVRLMVSRRVISLEHCIVANGPRAAKGKVVVEVNLQGVWESCTARTVAGPASPSSLQDCAWAGTGAESSTWRSPGNNDTVSTSHAQSSGMLLALNTAVLRIAPATQRRVLEDGAGIRKERWAAAVLALPLLMGPLPALHDDHGADRLASQDFASDVGSHHGSGFHSAAHAEPHATSFTAHRTTSSVADSLPDHLGPSTASVLSRFFGTTVTPSRHANTTVSASGAGARFQALVPSSFESRASGLNSGTGAVSNTGSGAGVPPSRFQKRAWILPLVSTLPHVVSSVTSGSNHSAGLPSGPSGRAMKFLVVSPPFVIAVDSFGQPDQRHAMLDIPTSFTGTRLEGTELQILDAAVVSDKYEWASTSSQGAEPMSTPACAGQTLELIQYEILAPESFSQWPLRLHLHGGAACTNFILAGSLRVSVYAPEATAKRAYRMVMKGDMQRVLDLLCSENIARSTGDNAWQQRIIGISVAHCLKRGRWKWALQFFSLAKRTHLHPCQLLAAIVPAILAGDATTGDAAGVTALRHAARASLQALVASQCHEQHAEVTALFMELLDSQPPEHLGTLLEGRTNRRPRNLELVSHKSTLEVDSTAAKQHSSAASVTEAKEACLQMAAVLCRSLEDELPGSAGAKPGEERFERLFNSLAAAGELYPHLERGLPGRLHYSKPTHCSTQAAQGSKAPVLTSFSHSLDAYASDMAISNGKQSVRISPRAAYHNGARQDEDRKGLDHLDWCKAAQIWLLELAGDWRSVETICWRPGLWGSKSSRQIEELDDGCRLRDHLASFLHRRGQARAVGLLLASLGKPQRALEVWMEEYYVQSSACHEHSQEVPLDELPALHESRTVDEHILSASALGTGNALSMLDPATPPPLGTPTTPVTNQSLLESQGLQSSDTLTPPAVEVDSAQLSAASSALLLAACASECMCDSDAVPSFDDSLISWLLHMPVQCSLAVLLSRKDIAFEDVFSPYHALGGLHIVSAGLSLATKAGTVEPVLPEESDTLEMSPEASDDDSSDSDGAAVNCSQLWLQVRYFRARVADAQAGAAGDVRNVHNGSTQCSGSKPGGDTELFWGLYLTQLLKMLLKSESFTERPVPTGDSEHAVYGSQTLQSGFSVEQPWMSGQFIGCLRSTEASSHVAAMLVPLRPVTIAPCAQLDQAPIIDTSEGLQADIAALPTPAAPVSPATPRLTSTPSLPVALLPSAELQLGSANTYSPIAQLFLEALRAAPPAVMASVSRNLEHMINGEPVKSALRKEVYLSVLENLRTKAALFKALHILTPAPYSPDSDEEDEVMYGGRKPAALQDLSMAISLAARYTISGTNSTSSEFSEQQAEAGHIDVGSCDIATQLWKELLARTTAAGKVLVQYNQQLVTASNSNQSKQLESDQDLLWSILKVSNLGNSNTCLTSASDDDSEPQQLLKDAAAAITSVVRTVSMRSEASTLHRFMRQQFKIQVARGTLSVEDSYVKWNEGPTSMDSSMEPEAVVQRTPDHSGDRRSIPPPGKDGSPWCGVCKRSLVQSGSRYFTKGNHISWSSASFVCSDPACVAAVTAPETDGAPASPGPVSARRPRSSSPGKLSSDQPKSLHPHQMKARINMPSEVHGAQALQPVDEPGSVSVLRKPPSGVFLQLSVSLEGLHKPPGRAATVAGVENMTCGTAHFGHRWLLSDRGYVSVFRHSTVGGGAAEILLADAGSSSPGKPVQPHERESGSAVLARSVPGSPAGSRRRNSNLACVVVNPDDPATAFVATEVPAQGAYESFATLSVQGHGDVARGAAHAGGSHLRRSSFRSAYSAVEPNVVACIVHALDRAVSPRATGAAASRLQMKLQRVLLPAEHSGSARVCDAVWGGEGRQVLLGTACGTLFCVDTAGAGITAEADNDGADTQALTARRIASIPEAYGSLEALAFARLDAGEAVLISTTTHVLLIAGHGIVGALRRFEKCRALWATAVVFEDLNDRSDVLSQTRLTVTQSPTSSVAHIVWLCGKVMHSVDMNVVGAAPSTSRPWCATAQNLLKEDTYSRIALPDAFLKGSCVSVAVLPHHVLVLCDSSAGVPQVNAIWRASGTHACSVSVFEDIGQPVSLMLDAEDPAASLDESMAIYVLGTAGAAKLDTQQGPLAGGWDLIRAGRYSQAAEKIRQAAQGPTGVGPVGESAMWGALGQALVERGWHVEGARALGRVVPGVLHATDGKHIRSFHDTILQFCGDGVPRTVLQAFLLSKLQTLTRHFENDLSVCGIVTWLLRLHLEDLHVATMRADVSAEASGEPAVEQARICALIRRHQAVVDYRTVLDLFRQHGHPKLQLFVMDLYGRHVDSFNMALQDKVPKALHLLHTIQTHKPELLPSLVAQLMWEHPIATCTVLAVGRSTIDPMLVVRAAFRYTKPSESPFFERVQEALQKFLTGHIEAGSVESGLHNLFVRLAALRGDEQELVRYLDGVDANRSTGSKSISGNTDSKKSPQEDTLAQLHFDSRSTLLLARQRKLNMAVHRLLILRGDISAALEYCKGVEDARDAVSRAPENRQRDLWLQFVRIRKETMPEITVRDLQDIVEATEGLLTFPDVVKFVSEEYRSSEEVQEALAANLEAGSAKLQILQRQFEGFGERMEARRKELERMREHRKKKSASPTAKCEACKGLLLKPPKRGAPYGGALPPVVAYIGSMYHTACAAIAHAKFMEPQARQKWELKLIALSRAPPKGGTLPPQASQAQKVAHQRIQVYLKELSDLLTKRGDPSLSLKQLDKLEENYGERQPGFEHELLKVPDPIL